MDLQTIVGIAVTVIGSGGAGAIVGKILDNRGNVQTKNIDELSAFRKEMRADIERLEAERDRDRREREIEREKDRKEIADLKAMQLAEVVRRESFEDRILNMIEYRLHDQPAWLKLAQEIKDGRERPDSILGAVRTVLPQRKPRILVVDDTDDTLEVLSVMVKAEGYDCHTANNGPDALQQIMTMKQLATPFDLVLLDYAMPKMDGEQVARAVRLQDGNGARTRIAFLTGNIEQIPPNLSAEIGIAGMLSKPVDAEELRDFIDNALHDRRATDRAVLN